MTGRAGRTSAGTAAGAGLALAGGALAAIGSLLPWERLSVAARLPSPFGLPTLSVRGTSMAFGPLALVCGIVLVAAGLVLRLPAGARSRRTAAIGALAGALAATDAVVAIARRHALVDAAFRRMLSTLAGTAVSDARVHAIESQLGLHVALGIGAVLALAGGVLGLVGGAVALVSARLPGVSAPTAEPPAGPSGSA